MLVVDVLKYNGTICPKESLFDWNLQVALDMLVQLRSNYSCK